MSAPKYLRTCFFLCSLALVLQPLQGFAQSNSGAPVTAPQPPRYGQHDFDFERRRWKTLLRRRQRPWTGSTTWVEYEGTTIVRKVWDGRANLVELDVTGPAGRIEALSPRLDNPESRPRSVP